MDYDKESNAAANQGSFLLFCPEEIFYIFYIINAYMN